MDARYKGVCLAVLALCSLAAIDRPRTFTDRSRNFVVHAPTPQIAKQVAQQAEVYRHKLAVEWLGKPIPNWRYPCVVNVRVGQVGAGGATTFVFNGNSVSDYKMNIQGPLDAILDSVLPHEVNHTIFAEHFRRPLPRWADEGAATFVENESERRRQMELAMQVLKTNRRIPMRNLLSIMDYPKDMQDVLHLYAEGYVLTELLIQNGGRAKFLKFLNTAHTEGWDRALHAYYGHPGTDAMEKKWSQWVLAGCPSQAAPEGTMLASNDPVDPAQLPSNLARSQAPEREAVTVEDLADSAAQNARAMAIPRRGAGLQAPKPTRRAAEPAMLANVDLGSETNFAAGRAGSATTRTADVAAPRSQRTAAPRQVAAKEELFEETDPEEEVRPPVRRSPAPRAAAPKNTVSRTLITPRLSSDSRLQPGKAQPFPTEKAELYADAAG